ncbi:reprolysin-like metallopeptidase [Amaricoccus tamworthensis]|uniref:VPLPA-CTERM sorting domain-containing protein n=1 Tax=Amaricoccus tamworthensis TaxID=57002 RepID=UPI003C797CC4
MSIRYLARASVRGFLAASLALLLGNSAAHAAFVTIDEPGLDAVFSQKSFGNKPIDVVIRPTRELNAPHLLEIDDQYDLNEVYSFSTASKPAIGMLFVDSITYCDGYGHTIIGCGWIGDSGTIVESVFSASSKGTSLQAHEIGHTLGLTHTERGLMEPYNHGSLELTRREARKIHLSDLVQKDRDGHFIEISPYVVTAVPIPASGLLLLGGVMALVAGSRLRRTA